MRRSAFADPTSLSSHRFPNTGLSRHGYAIGVWNHPGARRAHRRPFLVARGSVVARALGLMGALVSLVVWFFTIAAHPVSSILIIMVDFLILYALADRPYADAISYMASGSAAAGTLDREAEWERVSDPAGAAERLDSDPMLEAIALGGLAQISLLLSGLFATWVTVPRRIVGWLAGFGAGALISAITYDLTAQARALNDLELASWLLIGAGAFILGDYAIDRKIGPDDASGGALGIVLGSVVDGVPESLIFGIGVAAGTPVSVSFLSAVIVSNIPQALAPSAELVEGGWSRSRLVVMWGVVVIACAIAAGLGWLGGSIGQATGDRMSAFAAGGLLAMLTNSLMPFAFERGGNLAGLWTVIGFALAIPPRSL